MQYPKDNWSNSLNTWLNGTPEPFKTVDQRLMENLEWKSLTDEMGWDDYSPTDFNMPGDPANFDVDPNLGETGWLDTMGQWGNIAKGIGQLGTLGLGYSQFKAGQSQLKKDNAFRNQNFQAQRKTINNQLSDQYAAKLARYGGAGTPEGQALGSLDDYMKQRGV